MTEDFKSEEKEATSFKFGNYDGFEIDISKNKESSESPKFQSTLDLEERATLAVLARGQAITRRAILFGFAMILASAVFESLGGDYSRGLSPVGQLSASLSKLVPGLIGSFFLFSGAKSFLNKQKGKGRKPGKETWDAEFEGKARLLSNDAGLTARRYVVNYLIGQIVILVFIFVLGSHLGDQSNVFASVNLGQLMLIGTLLLWSAIAAAITLVKSKIFFGSNRFEVKLESSPLFLGQESVITISNANREPIHLEQVTLRCLQEKLIVGPTKSYDFRSVARGAVQFYAENRAYVLDAKGMKHIKCHFVIPNLPELSTSLVAKDPVYWCLDIKGEVDEGMVKTTYLLPVYKHM